MWTATTLVTRIIHERKIFHSPPSPLPSSSLLFTCSHIISKCHFRTHFSLLTSLHLSDLQCLQCELDSSESVGETDVRQEEKRDMRPVSKKRTSYPYPSHVYELAELKPASRWITRLQTHSNQEAEVGAGAALETVVEYARRSKLKKYMKQSTASQSR